MRKIYNRDAALGLTERERKAYSFKNAIEAAANNDWTKAGFEAECSRAVAQAHGRQPLGFYIPFEAEISTRDMTVGSTTAGGFLKGTDHRSDLFVDALTNRPIVRQLGAQVLTGLVGDVAIPAMNASVTAYWVAESGAPTEGAPTVRQIAMSPKCVGAYVDISRKLLKQSSPAADFIFREDMTRALAVALDAAAINGGGTNEPDGILQTNGIGSVALGTNGAAPTWAMLTSLISEVEIDNGDQGSQAFLSNPQVKSKLANTPRQASGVEGNFILDAPTYKQLLGWPLGISNNVPSTLEKGSSGAVCSAMIYGSWNNLVLGIWGSGVDVIVDPFTFSSSGGLRISCFLDCDIALRNPAAFAACQDILTT